METTLSAPEATHLLMTVLETPFAADDPSSDRDLALRVQTDGDESAFRQLYRRHTPRLLRFVLRLLGGTHREAEDVVQDTWVRAVEGLPRMEWRSTFGTWLSGIALNRVREELKRDGRWKFDELGELDPSRHSEPQRTPAADGSERVDLERAIRDLPSGYRTVLILHDLEGLTHQEIAQRCEISLGTSRSQLFHARRAVRRRLTGANSTTSTNTTTTFDRPSESNP